MSPTELVDDAVSLTLSCTKALGHPLSSYSEIEGYLLQYFIEGIGPNCSLSISYNPYISLITPLSFYHSTLRSALLAVAANQLRLLGDSRFQKEACLYKDNALRGLQQAIITDSLDYGAVATVLMLCFHDISDGCDPSWVAHLRGGLKLIEYVSARSRQCEPLRRFLTMYFVAHDIMSRTATESRYEDKISCSWLEADDLDEVRLFDAFQLGRRWKLTQVKIDGVMGCSRNLMTLIDRISALASEKQEILKFRPLTPVEIESYTSASNEIEMSLRFLKQNLPLHSSDRNELKRIAETKRLTALLYLQERLGLAADSPDDDTNIPSDPLTPGSAEMETSSSENALLSTRQCKRHLVSLIIKLISTLPNTATLLWPLFVLGNTGLDSEEHRRFILDRLEHIQKTRNLGSVRRARLAVKRAFRMRDLDYPSGHLWGDHKSGFISLA
ncbi:hypothetical protein MAP00_008435 [Monascus purpureus]|nr:hypothetical protein MAP00_008435 [Monascus purpureus]